MRCRKARALVSAAKLDAASRAMTLPASSANSEMIRTCLMQGFHLGQWVGKRKCAGARKLFLRPIPSQDLVQDDGAERRGANATHGEVAEFERQVAGAGGECRRDRDQVPRVGEIDAVLHPDSARHGSDQAEQYD